MDKLKAFVDWYLKLPVGARRGLYGALGASSVALLITTCVHPTYSTEVEHEERQEYLSP